MGGAPTSLAQIQKQRGQLSEKLREEGEQNGERAAEKERTSRDKIGRDWIKGEGGSVRGIREEGLREKMFQDAL